MPRVARSPEAVARARFEVLDGATRVFARSGFKGSTMQAIAEECGVTVPTVYAYFKSKRAILEALVEQVHNEMRAPFDATLPAGLTLSQRLEMLVRAQLEWVGRRGDALLFLGSLPADLRVDDCGEAIDDVTVPYVAWLAEWFGRWAAPGDLGDFSPEDAAWALWGLQHAVFERWLRSGGERPIEDDVGAVLRLFFGGVAG